MPAICSTCRPRCTTPGRRTTARQRSICITKKLSAADIELARNEAISYAAYNVIMHRFVTGPAGVGPGRLATRADIRQQMVDLGFDPDFTSTVGNSPAAVGNRIAQTVINHGLADGSNEANRYATPAGQFVPVNQPLTFDLPGTTMVDPNRWQPLHFLGGRIDQFGRPINEATQGHLTPFWGAGDAVRDDGRRSQPQRRVPRPGNAQAARRGDGRSLQAERRAGIPPLSSQLDPTDGVMIDISPATRGNTPNAPFTESYDQVGYAVNPYTGLPYTPQMVKQGDFGRVVAEFWADGPRSTAPPGHWNEIANDVSDKMELLGIPKRIGGTGPVVSDLEWDVKKYFALNGGMHDAAIAAWNHKGVYDSARPISFIRYMGQLGQSSDPNLMADLGGGNLVNTYHPDGLPLEPGLVEVITPPRRRQASGTSISPATRARSPSARGREPSTAPRRSTIRQKSAASTGLPPMTWMPYQLLGFVTPPFAGYVSGHSTYSRTGAEVLTLFTGSEFFPGGHL